MFLSFEGVSFELTSSWPPARGREVASCRPHATLCGSAGECWEAIFYAPARYLRPMCSESGVQFLTNLKNCPRHPKAPQGTPRAPQGSPRRPPKDPRGTPRDPQEAQMQLKESQVGAKIKPRAPQSQSKVNQNKPKGQTIYQQTPDQPPARPLCYFIFYI